MSFDFNTHNIGYIEQGGGGVTPSGTKTITENGLYNVETFAKADVNVQGGTEPVLVSLTVNPSTTTQMITPAANTDGYNTIQVSAVTSAIDSDIQANNIKAGVNILGVTGNVTELVGETTTITENGTYAPTIGNGFISVNVNVSGGGGSSFNSLYEVINGKLQRKTTPFSYKLADGVATTIDSFIINQAFQSLFVNSGIVSADFSALNIEISYNNCFARTFNNCKNLQSANFHNLTNFTGGNVFQYAFQDSSIESVDFSELTSITGSQCFSYAFASTKNLQSVTFPKLNTISGANIFASAFYNSEIKNIYFPALTSSSFGSNINQFNNMISSTHGCTIHFRSGLQSTISGLTGASSNFGGTNATILYDL